MCEAAVKRYFHFTLGNVQRFIEQARRTRDLWAGSYLVSWLSQRAIEEARPYARAVSVSERDAGRPSCRWTGPATEDSPFSEWVAAVPNHFEIEVDDERKGQLAGEAAAEAVRDQWEKIGEAASKFAALMPDKGQEEGVDMLWKRQMSTVWECLWVISDKASDLDARKNLRILFPKPEPGLKCTLCGERQELSRERRPGLANAWWSSLRDQLLNEKAKGHRELCRFTSLDFGKHERLCAVCFTKRLFPLLAHEAIGKAPPVNFPSTAFMAAADWLTQVLERGQAESANGRAIKAAAERFLDVAKPDVWPSERHNPLARLRAACEKAGLLGFDHIDGGAFFTDVLKERDFEVLESEADVAKAEDLLQRLKELQTAAAREGDALTRPSPFYTILMADGDEMGRLLDTFPERSSHIRDAIDRFARGCVPRILAERNGWLIYAGGEDVLALLPLDEAVSCAQDLRLAYEWAFEDAGCFREANGAAVIPRELVALSAAVVFPHVKTPLSAVLRDARRLLADEAKGKMGRDAFAARVWVRGGPVITWAMSWRDLVLRDTSGACGTPPGPSQAAVNGNLLMELKARLAPAGLGPADGRLSSKFLFQAQEIFEAAHGAKGDSWEIIQGSLLAAWDRSVHRSPGATSDRQALDVRREQDIQLIRTLCRRSLRTVDWTKAKKTKEQAVHLTYCGRYSIDALRLARFLVKKEP